MLREFSEYSQVKYIQKKILSLWTIMVRDLMVSCDLKHTLFAITEIMLASGNKHKNLLYNMPKILLCECCFRN